MVALWMEYDDDGGDGGGGGGKLICCLRQESIPAKIKKEKRCENEPSAAFTLCPCFVVFLSAKRQKSFALEWKNQPERDF